MAQLKVTQIKSAIGTKPNQRQTLRSLGLKRIHDSVVQEDRPEIRGMVATVPHLVTVEETSEREDIAMTLKVHHLRPAPGAHTPKTRVGRGEGSKGKTAGRGTKGTGARGNTSARFEGGQTPLHMRLPKLSGFKNNNKVVFQVVNLDRIAALFPQGGSIDPDTPGRRRRRPARSAGQGARHRRPRRREGRRARRTPSPRPPPRRSARPGAAPPASERRTPCPHRSQAPAGTPAGLVRPALRVRGPGCVANLTRPTQGRARAAGVRRGVPDARPPAQAAVLPGDDRRLPAGRLRARARGSRSRRSTAASSRPRPPTSATSTRWSTCSPAVRCCGCRSSRSGSCRTSRRASSCSCWWS